MMVRSAPELRKRDNSGLRLVYLHLDLLYSRFNRQLNGYRKTCCICRDRQPYLYIQDCTDRHSHNSDSTDRQAYRYVES